MTAEPCSGRRLGLSSTIAYGVLAQAQPCILGCVVCVNLGRVRDWDWVCFKAKQRSWFWRQLKSRISRQWFIQNVFLKWEITVISPVD